MHTLLPVLPPYIVANIYGKLCCSCNCIQLPDGHLLKFLARKVEGVKNIPTFKKITVKKG